MKRILKIFLYSAFFAALHAHTTIDTSLKLFFGPVVFKGWGDLRYGINAIPDSLARSFFTTELVILPSLMGKCNITLYDHFFIFGEMLGAWGTMTRATTKIGVISPTINEFGERNLFMNCQITEAKAGGGPKFKVRDNFSLSLAAGYSYELHQCLATYVQVPGGMDMFHTFSGPFVMIGGDLELTEKITVAPEYFFIIGKLYSTEQAINSVEAITSTSPFIGNTIALQGKYTINKHWCAGINFAYVNLQATKAVPAVLSGMDKTTLNNASLDTAGATVYIFTFFIAANF